MKVSRSLAITATTAALLLGPAVGANAASEHGVATGGKAPVTCTISAQAPYLSGSLIKGYGQTLCGADVAGLQIKVFVQKKMSGRWVNVGVPARGTYYDVYKVWGTGQVSFSHGIFRTKATGKVLFYGESTWRPIQAVSGPRSA